MDLESRFWRSLLEYISHPKRQPQREQRGGGEKEESSWREHWKISFLLGYNSSKILLTYVYDIRLGFDLHGRETYLVRFISFFVVLFMSYSISLLSPFVSSMSG